MNIWILAQALNDVFNNTSTINTALGSQCI